MQHEDFLARFVLTADGDEGAGVGGGGSEGDTAPAAGAGEGGDTDTAPASGATGGDTQANGAHSPWYGDLSDDLAKTGARYASAEEAVRAISEFRKSQGQMRVPGKDAAPEDWAKFHQALGVPEAADGYEFPELPEDQLTDEVKEARAAWAKTFHDNNIPAPAAKALIDAFRAEQEAIQAERAEMLKTNRAQQEEALRKEWKGAEYDKQIETSRRAVTEAANRAGISMDALNAMKLEDGRPVLDSAEFAKVFAVFGREMLEGSTPGPMTDAEVGNLQAEIEANDKALQAARAKGDDREVERLYQKEQELYGRKGRGPIVGSQGRAA